jgi:hypothetical protein
MANNDPTQQLRNTIANARKALDQLEQSLVAIMEDAALGRAARTLLVTQPNAKLNGGVRKPATPTPATRQARKPGKAGRAKRLSGKEAEKSVESILATLGSNKNGLSIGELSSATGLRAEAVSYRLGLLRKGKKVRMTGTRSQAKYFLPA